MKKQPFLSGERLDLRPLVEADLNEEYLSWLNDPEITRYLGIGRFPTTPAALRGYLQRFQDPDTQMILAMVDRGTGLHIGNVTLNRIHWIHRTADTGILIGRKEFWGKGYALEAWTLLLDYAFNQLGLRKIIAGAIAGHEGSLSPLRKLGFQEEGVLRKEYLIDGEYYDAIRMGLFQKEFRGKK